MEKIQENIVTADGIPLKISLARAQRRSKIVAFMMVFPLLVFIVIAFIGPIADMLLLSIDNSIVKKILPKSSEALQNWDEYSGEFFDFMKKKFIKTKRTKPLASRKPSSELYCICMGFY